MEQKDNMQLLTAGFSELLKTLAPYIATELRHEYGAAWWSQGIYGKLYDDQRANLPASGNEPELLKSLDIAACLLLMDIQWCEVFRKKLPRDCKNYVMELKGTRNKWAHAGSQGISDKDTWRALDTMSLLAEQINPDCAATINELHRIARYGDAQGSTAKTSNSLPTQPSKKIPGQIKVVSGLPSWREVMEPHQDVAAGRYKQAEFAADLAQVARGQGEPEYRDPVEFFNRTYVTEGMKGLLVQSLRRVCGLGGEPVIQLKTAFGGGKTHSMLALYHLMRNHAQTTQMDSLAPVLQAAGVSQIPSVHVAVLVGTALNPAQYKRPVNMPGITVNTLWGEMAMQLAQSVGDATLYNYVKEADKKGVSPGSETLTKLFDACGCCLVLMDELVAYAKKLYGVKGLPAGTFDNFITFIQELSEAARASKCSLVVASIPESDNEIGGEAGQRALDQIEHTFGRMEAIWKPVAASEGFEVVRRRLFLDCKDEAARDQVCKVFSQMYNENSADFPSECRELEYRERMISCYPIHPEVFDRLYEDWATLESFQRTRGVLRLMAAVIHELWMNRDAFPMIMPGSLPFDVSSVRDELTSYLNESWNGVVDSEVDGMQSIPRKNDQANTRYGKCLASRRVARTIMLGSAPDVSGQAVRGIEKARIRLGVVQPKENIAVFNDALATLQTSLAFLYSDGGGNRFWYDTRPTLRKVAADRAQQVSEDEALYEIEQRLRKLRKAPPFAGIHVCPSQSLEVPDEQSLRLVILPPKATHRAKDTESKALQGAKEILENRGSAARTYKNEIVFAALDESLVAETRLAAKQYLAWESIAKDYESLNLDATQKREVGQSMSRAEQTLNTKIQEAYQWLIYPRIDLDQGSEIVWETENVGSAGEDIVAKMASRLLTTEVVIAAWAPALLKMELDKLLWKDTDHIQILQLWDYLCTYCYLPRLTGYEVLESAIRQGLGVADYFGIAADFSEGKYVELSLGQEKGIINRSDLLVKPEVARSQIEVEEQAAREKAVRLAENAESAGYEFTPVSTQTVSNLDGSVGVSSTYIATPTEKPSSDPKFFSMEAMLDTTRINRDVQTIVDEIVRNLEHLDAVELELSLRVQAKADNGIPVPIVRAISENCQNLGIKDFDFRD